MSGTTTADPGTWIRGITIRQPWTTCILAGKDVENRPAPWSWRGWLLLHAGQATERAPMRDPLVATAIRSRALHTRAVIGVARLTDCHQDAAGSTGNRGYQKVRNSAGLDPTAWSAFLLGWASVRRCRAARRAGVGAVLND
ncbi:hypothetical protein [Streptomyces sp. NPDC045251]|uniref:hypothetical protein n=1 Tax=unclassified Streptomyces TaxID=2593676 RepID=UPI00340E8365